MRLSLIAALSANAVIGINNQLPWHIPGDLPRFKRLTLNKPVIMGRKTFESLPGPLSGRTNIVVTSNTHYPHSGIVLAHSPEQALILAESAIKENPHYTDEVMIIGGGVLYQHMLPLAQRLYLTKIDKHFQGDAFFPSIDPTQWREIHKETHQTSDNPAVCYAYLTLERIR